MKDVISVLIIEDDAFWIKTLEFFVRDFNFEVAGIAKTTEEALTAIAETEFDIALVDIHLNNKQSGIELGKILNKVYKKPYIFVTSNTEKEALQLAAAAGPSAYLVKPANASSLFIAIQNAINHFYFTDAVPAKAPTNEVQNYFFVKQGNKYRKINWTEVVYLESGKNYLSVFNAADQTVYFIRSSLQHTLQNIIPKHLVENFVQINRSEAINISFIEELSSAEVKTKFKVFEITETYYKELRKRLNIIA